MDSKVALLTCSRPLRVSKHGGVAVYSSQALHFALLAVSKKSGKTYLVEYSNAGFSSEEFDNLETAMAKFEPNSLIRKELLVYEEFGEIEESTFLDTKKQLESNMDWNAEKYNATSHNCATFVECFISKVTKLKVHLRYIMDRSLEDFRDHYLLDFGENPTKSLYLLPGSDLTFLLSVKNVKFEINNIPSILESVTFALDNFKLDDIPDFNKQPYSMLLKQGTKENLGKVISNFVVIQTKAKLETDSPSILANNVCDHYQNKILPLDFTNNDKSVNYQLDRVLLLSKELKNVRNTLALVFQKNVFISFVFSVLAVLTMLAIHSGIEKGMFGSNLMSVCSVYQWFYIILVLILSASIVKFNNYMKNNQVLVNLDIKINALKRAISLLSSIVGKETVDNQKGWLEKNLEKLTQKPKDSDMDVFNIRPKPKIIEQPNNLGVGVNVAIFIVCFWIYFGLVFLLMIAALKKLISSSHVKKD